jgi:hypothetical protein
MCFAGRHLVIDDQEGEVCSAVSLLGLESERRGDETGQQVEAAEIGIIADAGINLLRSNSQRINVRLRWVACARACVGVL